MELNTLNNLLELKQEGSFWDFKKEWYSSEKKEDLLHDIICMANNLENRDAYIIIGVDEENDFKVENINNDPNRKNTQKIIDFLRDKKFAGGIRPTVYVKELRVLTGAVDVIVIKNKFETPFYLVEKYKNIMPNNIYTRIIDTNTPKNKSADILHIEYLWKKRFRLITTPLERIMYYLKNKKDWEKSPPNWESERAYNKYYPEYTIEYTLADDEQRDGYEYYLFNQTDSRPHWNTIRIWYHQTLLEEMQGIFLDGARYFSPVPFTTGLSIKDPYHWDVWYKYFIKGTLRFIVHEFYFDHKNQMQVHPHRNFLECVLVFKSELEQSDFNEYVKENWEHMIRKKFDIHIPYMPPIQNCNMEEYRKEYKQVQILKIMLNDFRARNIKKQL